MFCSRLRSIAETTSGWMRVEWSEGESAKLTCGGDADDSPGSDEVDSLDDDRSPAENPARAFAFALRLARRRCMGSGMALRAVEAGRSQLRGCTGASIGRRGADAALSSAKRGQDGAARETTAVSSAVATALADRLGAHSAVQSGGHSLAGSTGLTDACEEAERSSADSSARKASRSGSLAPWREEDSSGA